jgi:hypothetical protein
MIDGPTPGHFIAKPAAGTGASLLMDGVSEIVGGHRAASLDIPADRAETDKTLTAIPVDGRALAFFDNINHSVDSGALASAMTKRFHSARVLGRTETIEVEVRVIWAFAGNNVTMTGELLRRCIPITLDAKSADPTRGRKFKHADVCANIAAHRWELVSASIILVQNWIAKGRREYQGQPLASFEEWSRKVGGVLDAAELPGFMANVADWKEAASDDTDDSLLRLMMMLAEYPIGTVFRPSGTVVSVMDLLNEAGDPANEVEAIMLNGWSYKELFDDTMGRVRVVYSNAAQVGKRLRASTRIPYAVGTDEDGLPVMLHLEERTAKRNGARYWIRVAKSAG